MRNSRFIELLNLYVDQQLSADDEIELKKAISQSEDRRQTFQQYCRIQKACAALFEQEKSVAPSSRLLALSLLEADRKIQAPAAGTRLSRYFVPVGLAAAIAVAFGVVHRSPSRQFESIAASTPPIEPISAPAKALLAAAPREEQPASAKINLFSVFATLSNAPALSQESTGDVVVENPGETGVSASWMRSVELTPVATLSDRMTLTPVSTAYESRASQTRSLKGAKAESAAFQFQR